MSDARRAFHLIVFGAALGLGAGNVLLALNPDLLSVAGVVRALGGAALVGAVAAAPSLLLRGGPGRGFWACLAAALAALALFAEHERTLYYFFLHHGARRLLVATTLVSGVFALLALVRAVRATPKPPRRLLVPLLVALAAIPLYGQRRPRPSPLAAPEAVPGTATRNVLVVGIDGASWELVSRLASEGRLPVLGRLLKEGAGGPLASLAPYDRAALWTTAATGKRPSKHGVVSGTLFETPLGDLRLLPRLLDFPPPDSLPLSRRRPADLSHRRSLAFWEILAARGHQAAVLGWPAADPPRPGQVVWATERLFGNDPGIEAGLPPEAASRVRLLAVPPANLDRPLARALEPEALASADRKAVGAVTGAARDLTVAAATLAFVPSGPGNVSALCLSGLASVARRYGPAAEPGRYWGSPAPEADAREKALLAYYRLLDETLGDLLERGGRDRTVCVFSPVGYGPPTLFRSVVRFLLGREPAATPDAGRDGFVVLWGSGIRAGVRLTSASVADLAPTLLVLAGEPVARDMDGRVLAEVFDERFSLRTSIPVIVTFEPGGPQ